MRGTRLLQLLVMFNLLGLLLIVLAAWGPRVAVMRGFPIRDERGQPLSSVFEESGGRRLVRVTKHIYDQVGVPAAPGRGCLSAGAPARQTLLKRLTTLVSIPSVYAAECTPGECGGARRAIYQLECGQDCGGGNYGWSRVSETGDPCQGSDIMGPECPAMDGSGFCKCQETACRLC